MIAFKRLDYIALITLVVLLALTGADEDPAEQPSVARETVPAMPVPLACGQRARLRTPRL